MISRQVLDCPLIQNCYLFSKPWQLSSLALWGGLFIFVVILDIAVSTLVSSRPPLVTFIILPESGAVGIIRVSTTYTTFSA